MTFVVLSQIQLMQKSWPDWKNCCLCRRISNALVHNSTIMKTYEDCLLYLGGGGIIANCQRSSDYFTFLLAATNLESQLNSVGLNVWGKVLPSCTHGTYLPRSAEWSILLYWVDLKPHSHPDTSCTYHRHAYTLHTCPRVTGTTILYDVLQVERPITRSPFILVFKGGSAWDPSSSCKVFRALDPIFTPP